MKAFLCKNAPLLTLLPVLALMGMIFVFSSQPAELSNQTSGGIVQLILDLFFPGFEKYDPARQAQITETVVLPEGAEKRQAVISSVNRETLFLYLPVF